MIAMRGDGTLYYSDSLYGTANTMPHWLQDDDASFMSADRTAKRMRKLVKAWRRFQMWVAGKEGIEMGFSATRQLSLCRQGDNINCGTVTLSTLLNCVSPENTIAYDEKDPYLCRVHLFNLTARFCIQRTDTAPPSLFPLPQLPPGVMTLSRTVVKEPIYIDDSSPKKPSHQSTAATPSTSGQPCFPLIAAPEKSKKREHAETSETDTNIDKSDKRRGMVSLGLDRPTPLRILPQQRS